MSSDAEQPDRADPPTSPRDTDIAAACLKFVTATLDARATPSSDDLAGLRAAATDWARAGIPVDTVLQAVHETCKAVLHQAIASSDSDFDALVAESLSVVDMLDRMNTAVASAYLQQRGMTMRRARGHLGPAAEADHLDDGAAVRNGSGRAQPGGEPAESCGGAG